MASAHLTCEGLVLGRRETGEHHWRLEVFSPEEGAVHALVRRRSKGRPQATVPDLFQAVTLELERSSRGPALFVREARVEAPYAAIANDYRAFLEAGAFARTVWKNLAHAESFAALYALMHQALDAFSRRVRPEVTHFKSLYLLGKQEGYPLKEQMLASWPAADREHTRQILTQPLGGEQPSAEVVKELLERLQHYLAAYTDILV